MTEQEIIEALNELDPDWRDHFSDPYVAADFYEVVYDYDPDPYVEYDELDFNDQ